MSFAFYQAELSSNLSFKWSRCQDSNLRPPWSLTRCFEQVELHLVIELCLAAPHGFEPWYPSPKPRVLPLNERAFLFLWFGASGRTWTDTPLRIRSWIWRACHFATEALKEGRKMEPRGLEPLTFCLQGRCSTNWAMTPFDGFDNFLSWNLWFGALGEVWTRDNLVKSQLLYQLSYERMLIVFSLILWRCLLNPQVLCSVITNQSRSLGWGFNPIIWMKINF